MDYFHDLHFSIIWNLILILILVKLSLRCRIFPNIYCLKQCLRWIWKSKLPPTVLKIRNVIHVFPLMWLPLIKGSWPLTKSGTELQHMLRGLLGIIWFTQHNHTGCLIIRFHNWFETTSQACLHLSCLTKMVFEISLCLSAARPILWPRHPSSWFQCSQISHRIKQLTAEITVSSLPTWARHRWRSSYYKRSTDWDLYTFCCRHTNNRDRLELSIYKDL